MSELSRTESPASPTKKASADVEVTARITHARSTDLRILLVNAAGSEQLVYDGSTATSALRSPFVITRNVAGRRRVGHRPLVPARHRLAHRHHWHTRQLVAHRHVALGLSALHRAAP